MVNGNGVSRGDRNRNARLARLRELVPLGNAIVAIDLADKKQMLVVTDHDSKVLARRTFRCKAWDLGSALDWAAERATAKGFAGVTVSCEPTGHRWRVLGQLAAERSMPFVCVQPMQTSWARRSEDLTFDKTDDKDAVLIARLTAQLRCYVPEPVDETWGRLRHLGARREELVIANVAQIQQIRALLECVWPAALETAAQPFKSQTWAGRDDAWCVERDGGDLDRTRRLGWGRFERAVRREIARRGGQTSRAADRTQPLRRAGRSGRGDRSPPRRTRTGRAGAGGLGRRPARLAETERRMVAVLDELQLTDLVTSIHGISAVGAAAILAETGDPHRFATARAMVKHAGLAPTGEALGHLHRSHQAHRPRQATTAGRGLARGVGITADQHRLRRQVSTPHDPRAQQAQADTGSDRDRRRDPAAPARRGHHRPGLGPTDRHRRGQEEQRHLGRLTRPTIR